MLIDPTLATRFQVGKVDHPSDGVLGVTGDKEIADIIVPVKILALATMAIESVPGAEFNATHDGKAHCNSPGFDESTWSLFG